MNKRLALCVGINAYEGAPLSGCVNDARDWLKLLDSLGYDCHLLLDHNATAANITSSLTELIRTARFADRVVFTFSGHGSWIPDASGDESDGRDEVLCAYDFNSGGLISDDELHAIALMKHWGTRLTFFSDSCHSGTVNKFANVTPRSNTRIRFLPPDQFLEGPDLSRARELSDRSPKTLPRRTSSSVLFSGCGDFQYSYDALINGRWNGAFTEAALRTYRQGIKYKTWYKELGLPNETYDQEPQLSAKPHQKYWSL